MISMNYDMIWTGRVNHAVQSYVLPRRAEEGSEIVLARLAISRINNVDLYILCSEFSLPCALGYRDAALASQCFYNEIESTLLCC